MEEIITEKKYPIRNIWFFKQIFLGCIFILFYFLVCFLSWVGGGFQVTSDGVIVFLSLSLFFILVFMFLPVVNLFRRKNFHYSLDEHFITLHQGIVSKQNRNISYGRIQEIFIGQKLFDRIFGLASLTFADISEGGYSNMDDDGYISAGRSSYEALGFVGNKVHIPGLKKSDAEALKAVIQQKIKENPIEDSQSGL
jgi:membrane protein YdbS with pleckstrin-like domain